MYQLTPDQALVQTVDFFTPIVDDPYTFGQIAATNALSDIYAMGGRPLTALALVCFPDKAELEILERILAGGLSKMIEAGCTIIGGHSIRDEETKFGYSVTGLIHPKKILQNQGAKPGDKLILTKALGTGVISTAIKKGVAQQSWIEAAIRSMTTLNKKAAEAIAGTNTENGVPHFSPSLREVGISTKGVESNSTEGNREGHGFSRANTEHQKQGALAPGAQPFQIHSMTDITGFGLLGHLREILLASNVSAILLATRIPLLTGALDCIHAGHVPGGLTNNRNFAECLVEYDDAVPEDLRTILYDPQTAGGLLISTPDAEAVLGALTASQVPAEIIGEVLPNTKPRIRVTY